LASVSASVPAVFAPLSSLSEMMIECARLALLQKDYVNALENMLTVASVDDHPEVTAALAIVVLEIIAALRLAVGASEVKVRLLGWADQSGSDLNYRILRQCFDYDTLGNILEQTRLRSGELGSWNGRDKASEHLLINLNTVLIKEGAYVQALPKNISTANRLDRSIIYVVRGILWAVGFIFLFAAMSSIIYLASNSATNADINTHSFNSTDHSVDVLATLQYLWNFVRSREGVIYLLLFLVLKTLMRLVRKFQLTEARELSTAAMLVIVFFISAIAFGSKDIKNFAINTVELAKQSVSVYKRREPRADNSIRQDCSTCAISFVVI
jgi:hypothetical protein